SLGELLFGATFFLAGVLVRSHMAPSRTRIVVGVFVAVLAYFVFAEPAHLALAGDEIRALDGRVREGVTIQSVHYTCVPAALATVLRRWSVEASEGELAHALRTAFQGTHPARVPIAVEQFAGARGLRAQIVSTSLEELERANRPAIILGYSGGIRHAVALVGLDAGGITIGDPL